MRVLVTAGNTREPIDDVRDWGNRFTGNTGYSIAIAMSKVADVTLLTSNAAHRDEARRLHPRINATGFTSHSDLKRILAATMSSGDSINAVFMTAAIADYTPTGAYHVVRRELDDRTGEEKWVVSNAQAGKIKSTFDEIAFLGKRTEKLVDLFRSEWRYRGLLVKFKLEVGLGRDQLIRVGEASRVSSGADYLVANMLDMVTGDGAGAYLVAERSVEFIPRNELAARLVRLVDK